MFVSCVIGVLISRCTAMLTVVNAVRTKVCIDCSVKYGG